MKGNAVSFKWNRSFWGECMTSPALKSALQSAAEERASAADARVGQSSQHREYRNPNFVAKTAIRHGTSSNYLVGLVIASNPRSIYKSRHDGALKS